MKQVMSNEDLAILHDLVKSSLQSARIEVARRLQAVKLPPSAKVRRVTIEPGDQGSGWKSGYEDVQVGALYFDHTTYSIADSSIRHRLLGLREQLQGLADFLNTKTSLAERPANFVPNETGAEAILLRYVNPLAVYYLQTLTDLAADDQELIDRLTAELEELITQDGAYHTNQLAIDGIVPAGLYSYRNVTLRPLSRLERGAFAERWMLVGTRHEPLPGSNLLLPSTFTTSLPTALIEVTTKRPIPSQLDPSRLPNRIVLAFFLSGFELSGTGIMPDFDRPRWASFGVSHGPFPLAEKVSVTAKTISQAEFESIVDLAYKMPDFGGAEGNSKEIVLFRVLRGCGMHWQESGFLDFAIALEAALLGGEKTELSYKFKLYGALFLKEEFDPNETFKRLDRIYKVRSNLVHGGRVKPADLSAATNDAVELAKTVARKAIQDGWPNRANLDALALTAPEMGIGEN